MELPVQQDPQEMMVTQDQMEPPDPQDKQELPDKKVNVANEVLLDNQDKREALASPENQEKRAQKEIVDQVVSPENQDELENKE